METTFKISSVKKVIGLEEIASTHTLARTLAAGQEADGTLVLACHQTDAIDRTGRPFYAGEGGVYFSLIVTPSKQTTAEKLSLALANAVSDTVVNVLEIKTKMTSSGDILAYDKTSRSWKKFAGIIAEPADANTWIIGAGIYLNNRLPVSLKNTCISLKTILGSATSKELFLDDVLNNFWKEYAFI